MGNVTVVFPKKGEPVVTEDHKGVLSGQPITWEIYNHDKSIKSVRLEFEKGKFFEGAQGGPNACVKSFTFANGNGYAVMLGKAPVLPTKKRRRDKYSVYGYSSSDGSGKPKVALDPEIITDPPAPPIGQN